MNDRIQVMKIVNCRSQTRLFNIVENWAKKNLLISCDAQLTRDLQNREMLGLTMIAEKIALPHVKTNYVQHNCVLVTQLDQPIIWSTGYQVSVVIFLLVNQVNEFVNRLMTERADESVLEQLENVHYSTAEIEKLLKEGEM